MEINEEEMLRKEREAASMRSGVTETYQSVKSELEYMDNCNRTIFHRCCLEQNPRILLLFIKKLKNVAETEE